jgi:hypothetical protein
MAEVQDILSSLTDALRDERANLEALMMQYELPREELDPFVSIIRRLRAALMPVKPSRRFVNRLRADLRGVPQYTVIDRIRFLPAQVHIAAGVALLAGFFMLITRRRVPTMQRKAQEAAPVT